MQRALIAGLVLVLLFAPVSASVILFSPGSDSLSSLGVKDITDGPGDCVILATDNGRSVFNGTWEIVHVDRKEYRSGPLGDFVTAVEYDSEKRLWIGYSNGLQILEDSSYTTIDDQQLLKNLAINDLQSRGTEMWVATGHAGLHRYCDGGWTWFRPHGAEGLGAYEIHSMAVDYATGVLYCAAEDGSLWTVAGEAGGAAVGRFDGDSLPGRTALESCPFGGVAEFNDTAVHLIAPDGRVRQVVNAGDLFGDALQINDISFTDEGTLVVATTRGLFFWENDTATRRLGPKEGIGDQVIERVYVDNAGRIWFFNRLYAGIFLPGEGDDLLVVAAPPSSPAPSPTAGDTPTAEPSMVLLEEETVEPPAPSLADTMLEMVGDAIDALFELFGVEK